MRFHNLSLRSCQYVVFALFFPLGYLFITRNIGNVWSATQVTQGISKGKEGESESENETGKVRESLKESETETNVTGGAKVRQEECDLPMKPKLVSK